MQVLEKFSIGTECYFGVNAALEVPRYLAAHGLGRPAVIIDEAISQLPPFETLFEKWKTDGLALSAVFRSRSEIEPDYDYLDEVAASLRAHEPNVVIGVGGGSVLDLAKGVGILLKNEGSGIDYRGMDKVEEPGTPVVLLPTTAGTGSEVTKTASFIDRNDKTKLGINGKYVDCLVSFLDPSQLTCCPPSVTVSAGIDALVHAIEAASTKGANSVSTLFGAEAVRLLFASLPLAVQQPENLVGRSQSLLGSYYAGIAMWNAQGGPASAISYPVGVHFGVPHGFAGGILLPHVVSFNLNVGYTDAYAFLFDHLNRDNAAHMKDPVAQARAFKDALFDLYEKINVPKTLTQWGIGRGEVQKLTELTMNQRKEGLDCNPVNFHEENVRQILEAVTA